MLSPAQQAMLDEINSGKSVLFCSGINARAFYRGTMKTAPVRTLFKLLEMDLVDKTDEDWRGFEVVSKEKTNASA